MRAEDPAPGTHSLVLCHRNRRSKLPTPEQQRTLPLHAKAVEKLNMEYLYQHVLSPSAAARVKHLLSCLNYDPRAPAELPRPMFRMPAAHAKRMCDIGVFEDLGKVEDLDLSQYNSMNYFTVHEVRDAGDRLRPICWPLALLLLSQYRSQHRLKTVDDYRRLALLGGTAATFDLAASFWQVPLPKESKLVCVTDDGRVVRMTGFPTVPMLPAKSCTSSRPRSRVIRSTASARVKRASLPVPSLVTARCTLTMSSSVVHTEPSVPRCS